MGEYFGNYAHFPTVTYKYKYVTINLEVITRVSPQPILESILEKNIINNSITLWKKYGLLE